MFLRLIFVGVFFFINLIILRHYLPVLQQDTTFTARKELWLNVQQYKWTFFGVWLILRVFPAAERTRKKSLDTRLPLTTNILLTYLLSPLSCGRLYSGFFFLFLKENLPDPALQQWA